MNKLKTVETINFAIQTLEFCEIWNNIEITAHRIYVEDITVNVNFLINNKIYLLVVNHDKSCEIWTIRRGIVDKKFNYSDVDIIHGKFLEN